MAPASDDVPMVSFPPEGIASTGDPAFNTLWTLLHTPAVTVPAGVGPKGLPLGAQIVTRRGEDAAALMWGEWLHAAIHGAIDG